MVRLHVPPAPVRVMVALKLVDFRPAPSGLARMETPVQGMDGLAARKIAMILHCVWASGTPFRSDLAAAA